MAETGPVILMIEGESSSTGSSGSKWAGLRWSIATHCGLPHYVHNKGLTSLQPETGKTFGVWWLSWQINSYLAVTGPSGRGLQWQAPIDQAAAVSWNKTLPEHLPRNTGCDNVHTQVLHGKS